MNTYARRMLAIALIATVPLLPACKRAQERAQEAAVEAALEQATGAKVDVEKSGNAMTIKTGQGDIAIATAEDGGSVALPADFPADVFLPGQRKVASAMDMAGMQMVNLTTPSAMAAVSTDLEKAMQAQGWKREMAMQAAADSATLIYSKDKRQAVYTLLKSDAGTELAIRTGGEG